MKILSISFTYFLLEEYYTIWPHKAVADALFYCFPAKENQNISVITEAPISISATKFPRAETSTNIHRIKYPQNTETNEENNEAKFSQTIRTYDFHSDDFERLNMSS